MYVEDDHTLTRTDSHKDGRFLLFFPSLCELSLEDITWPTHTDKSCALGWFAKCSKDRFDYFPSRFLHVLIVWLSQNFAMKQSLPTSENLSSVHESSSDRDLVTEVHAYNPRCHVWRTGLHWLMENGVEGFC